LIITRTCVAFAESRWQKRQILKVRAVRTKRQASTPDKILSNIRVLELQFIEVLCLVISQ